MFESMAGSDPTSRAPEAETAAPLALQLLGAWDARVQGRPMRPLRSRKGQWLLALLLLQDGRAVEREWLASLLWRDSSTSQALYNLRRNLCLDLAGADVDVLRFDAAIAAGDEPSLERAVRLYRGPLLMECCEEWI